MRTWRVWAAGSARDSPVPSPLPVTAAVSPYRRPEGALCLCWCLVYRSAAVHSWCKCMTVTQLVRDRYPSVSHGEYPCKHYISEASIAVK